MRNRDMYSITMIILLGDLSANVGREDILNQQLGIRVYMKLVIEMELG